MNLNEGELLKEMEIQFHLQGQMVDQIILISNLFTIQFRNELINDSHNSISDIKNLIEIDIKSCPFIKLA